MKKTGNSLNKLVSAIGVILCLVFGLLLVFNLTIIAKGLINPNEPPSVFGVTPLVVKSGSMSSNTQHTLHADELVDITPDEIAALKPGDTVYTQYADYKVKSIIVGVHNVDPQNPVFIVERPMDDHIEIGDLIFSKKIDPAELKVGDVISFMENSSVVTHRIIGINNQNGELSFKTKGDANNGEDTGSVPADKLVGVYKSRIPALGDFIYFLQKPLGMAVFIGVPVIMFIVYDIIRRSRSNKKDDARTEELEKELARLRAIADEHEKRSESAPKADGE